MIIKWETDEERRQIIKTLKEEKVSLEEMADSLCVTQSVLREDLESLDD